MKAGGRGESSGSYLVSLGGIDAGLVTLLGLAGPLVVVPAPLLSPVVLPVRCLGSAPGALADVVVGLALVTVVVVVAGVAMVVVVAAGAAGRGRAATVAV